jgi:hypothetical protein
LEFPAESETARTKLDVPLAAGVPEIVPELSAKPSPCGRAPEAIEKLYGAVPPLTFTVVL